MRTLLLRLKPENRRVEVLDCFTLGNGTPVANLIHQSRPTSVKLGTHSRMQHARRMRPCCVMRSHRSQANKVSFDAHCARDCVYQVWGPTDKFDEPGSQREGVPFSSVKQLRTSTLRFSGFGLSNKKVGVYEAFFVRRNLKAGQTKLF